MPKKICSGVTLNALTTKKFKTSMFMVTYILPLTPENAAGCSLLAGVLKRGSKSFPTLRDISIRREELYSASLAFMTQKNGEALYFSAYTSFLDNAYVPDGSDLFASSLELLSDVLYSPLVGNGEFNIDYVNSEKENLINLILEKLNNKASYSIERCLSIMCENEPFSIPASGYVDDVKAYDGKKLYELYKHITAEAPVVISYAGAQDEDAVLNYVNTKLPPFAPRGSIVPATDSTDPKTPLTTVIEELPAAQGKLTIGMRVGIDSAGADYPAFALFNEIYGGSPSSKLFTVIREKMSLCYYCSTGGDRYKGVMYVTSGIENENFEKTRDGILAQLKEIADGCIRDDEITSAKKSLISSCRSVGDSTYALASWYLMRSVTGDMFTPEDMICRVNALAKDDIVRAAKSIRVQLIYFLRGVKEGQNEYSDEN